MGSHTDRRDPKSSNDARTVGADEALSVSAIPTQPRRHQLEPIAQLCACGLMKNISTNIEFLSLCCYCSILFWTSTLPWANINLVNFIGTFTIWNSFRSPEIDNIFCLPSNGQNGSILEFIVCRKSFFSGRVRGNSHLATAFLLDGTVSEIAIPICDVEIWNFWGWNVFLLMNKLGFRCYKISIMNLRCCWTVKGTSGRPFTPQCVAVLRPILGGGSREASASAAVNKNSTERIN